jgi:hypothetical protein
MVVSAVCPILEGIVVVGRGLHQAPEWGSAPSGGLGDHRSHSAEQEPPDVDTLVDGSEDPVLPDVQSLVSIDEADSVVGEGVPAGGGVADDVAVGERYANGSLVKSGFGLPQAET